MWSGISLKWEKISPCRFHKGFKLVNKFAMLTYRNLLGIKVITVWAVLHTSQHLWQLTTELFDCKSFAITFRLCVWCKTTAILFRKTRVSLDESVGTWECGSSRPVHHRFKPTHSAHGHSHRPGTGARAGTSTRQKPGCRAVSATHIQTYIYYSFNMVW